jgi:hypothetical protein
VNNNCPTCGALYNVAAKDIGRKLKCKKCGAALRVTENGLELEDDAKAASDPKPGSKSSPAMIEDDDEPVVKKKSRDRGPRGNPLAAVGGLPTVLFGVGVFFVIVFTSLPIIGVAGTDRANAYVDKLNNELKVKKDALAPKNKKPADWTDADRKAVQEGSEKLDEEYAKKLKDAALDAETTKIANRRDVWMERYGLMFGFILVSFGCIGYLRADEPLSLKIVMGVILAFMMMVMFGTFGVQGCGNPLGKG